MHRTLVRTATPNAALTLGAAVFAVALASPAFAQTTVRCESKDGSRVSCPADTSQGVMLSKQLSTDGCWKDENWGTDAKGIWVSDHCAAEFTVSGSSTKPAASTKTSTKEEEKKESGGKTKLIIGGVATAAVVTAIAAGGGDDDNDDENDRGYNYDGDGDIIRCESSDGRRTTCHIYANSRVELVRQLSEEDCRKGRSWGTTSDDIWVDNGCRGDFRVRSNNREERVQRNEQNDAQQAKEKARNLNKEQVKAKVNKGGGL